LQPELDCVPPDVGKGAAKIVGPYETVPDDALFRGTERRPGAKSGEIAGVPFEIKIHYGRN
jgi:hypothetical protein